MYSHLLTLIAGTVLSLCVCMCVCVCVWCVYVFLLNKSSKFFGHTHLWGDRLCPDTLDFTWGYSTLICSQHFLSLLCFCWTLADQSLILAIKDKGFGEQDSAPKIQVPPTRSYVSLCFCFFSHLTLFPVGQASFLFQSALLRYNWYTLHWPS